MRRRSLKQEDGMSFRAGGGVLSALEREDHACVAQADR